MKSLELTQMENLQGGQAAKRVGRHVACVIASSMMTMTLGPVAGMAMGAVCSLGDLL